MRVCSITSEVFVGRRDGFGKLVRVIGRELVKRGLWLYLRNLVNNLSGFIYWIAISAIGGAEIVGARRNIR